MSTETIIPPTNPSDRPPAPVNPTVQTRPTSQKAPTTSRPSSDKIPDFTKVKAPVQSSLQEGIKKLWADPAPTPTAAPVAPVQAAPVAPIIAQAAPESIGTPPVAPEAATPPPTVPEDRFGDIAEPEGISDAGKKGWKALKTKAQTEIIMAERKLADAEAQLATLRKATPADMADHEKLKGDLKSAHDRLAILDVQSHPDFTRQYIEPRAKALAEATEILTYNNKAAADAALLAKPQKDFNAAVAEMTKDMNAMDANTVQTAMRSAYKLAGEERAALAKAGELKDGLVSRDAQQRTQAFEKTYGKVGSEQFIQPREAPADATAEQKAEVAEFNRVLAQSRQMAERNAFGRLSLDDQAAVAIKAANHDIMVQHVVPVLKKGFVALTAERDALKAELQAIKGLKAPGSFTAPAPVDTGEVKDAKYYLRQAFGKK